MAKLSYFKYIMPKMIPFSVRNAQDNAQFSSSGHKRVKMYPKCWKGVYTKDVRAGCCTRIRITKKCMC